MNASLSSSIEKLTPALAALFDKIRDDSRDGEGVTRDAFGPRETQAAITVEAFAKREGLETSYDHGGNLHIMPPGQGSAPPEIMIGSHLDSVPIGGNYDGLAGVIAGLAVLSAFDAGGCRQETKSTGYWLSWRGEPLVQSGLSRQQAVIR